MLWRPLPKVCGLTARVVTKSCTVFLVLLLILIVGPNLSLKAFPLVGSNGRVLSRDICLNSPGPDHWLREQALWRMTHWERSAKCLISACKVIPFPHASWGRYPCYKRHPACATPEHILVRLLFGRSLAMHLTSEHGQDEVPSHLPFSNAPSVSTSP